MSRGETPAVLPLTAVRFCLSFLIFLLSHERGILHYGTNEATKSPVVREYKIGDITYIVKAVVKDGVKEDAATKVRRLIHNDLNRGKSPV